MKQRPDPASIIVCQREDCNQMIARLDPDGLRVVVGDSRIIAGGIVLVRCASCSYVTSIEPPSVEREDQG